jgi:hypothetical protein
VRAELKQALALLQAGEEPLFALFRAKVTPDSPAWALVESIVAPRTVALDRFVESVAPAWVAGKLEITEALEQRWQELHAGTEREQRLRPWLEDPKRTQAEVAQVLTTAIHRSKRLEGESRAALPGLHRRAQGEQDS